MGSRGNICCMAWRIVCLLVALMVWLPVRARGQGCGSNAASTIATDRPQITNSSIVVPCGSLQFENGFEQIGSAGHEGFDLPETSIRFGITNKTELRFAPPNYLYNDDTGSAFANGSGDSIL